MKFTKHLPFVSFLLANGCGWATIDPSRDCRFVPCPPTTVSDAATAEQTTVDVAAEPGNDSVSDNATAAHDAPHNASDALSDTAMVDRVVDSHTIDAHDAHATTDAVAEPGVPDATAMEVATAADAAPLPELVVAYMGPVVRNNLRGAQDRAVFTFGLFVYGPGPLVVRIPVRIMGTNATNPLLGLVRGSYGTAYFRDIKVRNAETGETVSGPRAYPPDLPSNTWDTGIMPMPDAFTVWPGHPYMFNVTIDIAETEDQTGELINRTYIASVGEGTRFFRDGDVRRASDLSTVDPRAILNNVPIAGNPFTVVTSVLAVQLASTPTSQTVTIGSRDVRSPGLMLSNQSPAELAIRSVTLTGMGETDRFGFRPSSFSNVVMNCALFDGDTRLTLDELTYTHRRTGRVVLRPNLRLGPGISRRVEVVCSPDDEVARTIGDRYTVGIATPDDLVVEETATGLSATVTVDDALRVQAGSASGTPRVVVTVRE